jgi:hypothetical protein
VKFNIELIKFRGQTKLSVLNKSFFEAEFTNLGLLMSSGLVPLNPGRQQGSLQARVAQASSTPQLNYGKASTTDCRSNFVKLLYTL